MRHDSYLKVLLTVTACLLSVDLWTRLADGPMLASQVQAQSRSTNPNARKPMRGVGTASTDSVMQRKEIIDLLKAMQAEMVGLRSDLKHMTIKVEVANLPTKKTRP
jgi:hypothetical protein